MSGESRFTGNALFLHATPDAKPVPTFAGIASSLCLPQFRTQNRFPLLLELLRQTSGEPAGAPVDA
jgi:hypothetical protein